MWKDFAWSIGYCDSILPEKGPKHMSLVSAYTSAHTRFQCSMSSDWGGLTKLSRSCWKSNAKQTILNIGHSPWFVVPPELEAVALFAGYPWKKANASSQEMTTITATATFDCVKRNQKNVGHDTSLSQRKFQKLLQRAELTVLRRHFLALHVRLYCLPHWRQQHNFIQQNNRKERLAQFTQKEFVANFSGNNLPGSLTSKPWGFLCKTCAAACTSYTHTSPCLDCPARERNTKVRLRNKISLARCGRHHVGSNNHV